MHVLKRIHHWLRPDGVLLDLHPEPEPPLVAVIVSGLQKQALGTIDNAAVIANIHCAREALKSVIDAGWFALDRTVVFDFLLHFPTVDDWLRHRQERRATSVVDQLIIERARELLSTSAGAELVVSERMRASRLVRLGRPA